jgi:DNA polymerase-1
VDKIYIIDASPIFYKSFFAIPMLTSKNGIPTNAAYGFTNTIISFLKKYDPKYVAVCFDSKSKFRTELYDGYKIDRKPMASNLYAQVPIIKNLTESLGLSVIDVAGYEADDLIGMLAKLAEKEGREVVIISPDKDLCQLVNDQTTVLDLSKKVVYDAAAVKAKFGVNPDQIVDLLALCGDSVDGIPGVLGIGGKSAIQLINDYSSIENIYKNLPSLKEGLRNKLINGKFSCEVSKQLATIITENATSIENVEQLSRGYFDKNKLVALFDALNFISLKDKISDLE